MSAIVRAPTAETGGLELAGELTVFLWDGRKVPDAAAAMELLRRHREILYGTPGRVRRRRGAEFPGLLNSGERRIC